MKNQVLKEGYRKSKNFFLSDFHFQNYFQTTLKEDYDTLISDWEFVGEKAANEMNRLSYWADKYPPELIKRTPLGETKDEISFHPSYWKLMEIAVHSKMFQYKWNEKFRNHYSKNAHKIGFSLGYLYSMTECGIFCPLCMTDGAARLIDKFGSESHKKELIPHIGTNNPEDFYTGAMFLTEKTGGSDVGANLVSAKSLGNNYYALNGEKWFCSNANADLAFVLARTNPEVQGTKGLSLFLLRNVDSKGNSNYKEIIRLKEKMGVKSMASAEIIFHNTEAELIGNEGEGFKLMAEMINLSRLYNSVAAVAAHRRAIIEAWQHLAFRSLFGKDALSHILIQEDFFQLGAEWISDFAITFQAVDWLDTADHGNELAKSLCRILIPICKYITAENAYKGIQKSMELMGGIGYIEENTLPRLMRDALVLPIWEGAGNIMFLDMYRAALKSNALLDMLNFIHSALKKINNKKINEIFEKLIADFKKILAEPNPNEINIRYLFQKLIPFVKIAILSEHAHNQSFSLAMDYGITKLENHNPSISNINISNVEKIINWNF
jgi:alkylation response protein AidB-like acyl-CoA dehydrogenase